MSMWKRLLGWMILCGIGLALLVIGTDYLTVDSHPNPALIGLGLVIFFFGLVVLFWPSDGS